LAPKRIARNCVSVKVTITGAAAKDLPKDIGEELRFCRLVLESLVL